MTTLASAALRLARAYCARQGWTKSSAIKDSWVSEDTRLRTDLNAAEAAFREAEKLDPIAYAFTRDQITGRLLDAWHAGYNAGLDEEHDHDEVECNDDYIDRILNELDAALSPKPEAAL